MSKGGSGVPVRQERGGVAWGRLRSEWEKLNSAFWLIPALITAGSVVLFVATHYLDRVAETDLSELPVIFSGGATAARSVLSTIAGSLITVIATLFSLTVVTLQLASSSYTPRVLRNFTSDRGVQAVLGTYIATFLYALLVLRVIRVPEDAGPTFLPVISITVSILLALACVALLIYFIARVVGMIQSSTIVGMAHRDMARTVAELEDIPDEPGTSEEMPEAAGLPAGEPGVILARESGYVQYVNVDAVVDAAAGGLDGAETALVEIPFGPGRFVAAGLPILEVRPGRKLDLRAERRVRGAFFFGQERSFQQDFAFGLRQLSDIALRGLSPAVNDPTTAMQAMDRMEAIFIALGEKAMPRRTRVREVDGTLVLVRVGHYGFDDVVGLAFDQIRRSAFASGEVAVLERLLEILDRALRANESPDRRRPLWARAFTVASLAPKQVADPGDAVNLVLKAVEVGERLVETGRWEIVRADLGELAELCEGLRGGERVREAVEVAVGERATPDPPHRE